MFVAKCEIKTVKENGEFVIRLFRIFITTTRLLTFATHNKRVLADATYKLITEGYPILTIGTTDNQRHYHSFGFCIVYREREDNFSFLFSAVQKAVKAVHNHDYSPDTLIADNAPAIENGNIKYE